MKFTLSLRPLYLVSLLGTLFGIGLTTFILVDGGSIYINDPFVNLLIFTWIFLPFYVVLGLLTLKNGLIGDKQFAVYSWAAIFTLIIVDSYFYYVQTGNPDPILPFGLLIGPAAAFLVWGISAIFIRLTKRSIV